MVCGRLHKLGDSRMFGGGRWTRTEVVRIAEGAWRWLHKLGDSRMFSGGRPKSVRLCRSLTLRDAPRSCALSPRLSRDLSDSRRLSPHGCISTDFARVMEAMRPRAIDGRHSSPG